MADKASSAGAQVVVAVIGRPHGVKGAVALQLRTDQAERRFREGNVFSLHDAAQTDLSHLTLRWYRKNPAGQAVAAFDQITDRDAAQALRGAELIAEVDTDEETDAWYPFQLRGTAVVLPDETAVGEVAGIINRVGQDLLEIRQLDGSLALVPLVRALVPLIDVDAGRIVIDPPDGLVQARPLGPADGRAGGGNAD
jgi:16S rRNA processing protein RimM